MNWYYVEAGQQAGPVDDAQLEALRASGKIQPDTLIWREGMANWAPYSTAKSSGPQPAGGAANTTAAEAVCTECGRIFPVDNMIRYGNAHVCAGCKPIFMQKLAEGAKINTGTLNYAGFWIRFAAKFVDGLILGIPFMIIFFWVIFSRARSFERGQVNFLPTLLQFGFMLLQMGYQIFFLGKYGATPGKMACGIKVVTSDGGRIGFGRAAGRFFAELLSGLVCYIGYIMVAFDDQKRALHDHICSTRVVYK
jgi:uncharacterized RDD family membrane protein YckC